MFVINGSNVKMALAISIAKLILFKLNERWATPSYVRLIYAFISTNGQWLCDCGLTN